MSTFEPVVSWQPLLLSPQLPARVHIHRSAGLLIDWTDYDRWKRTSHGPLGQYCGQAAALRTEDRRRSLRSHQYLWRLLPSQMYVPHSSRTPKQAERPAIPDCPPSGPSYLNADSIRITVKYLAYLRKMTRYNPTRGGMLPNNLDCRGCNQHPSRRRLIE